MGRKDFEGGRDAFIRRSGSERQFLDYFLGRPHPASTRSVGRNDRTSRTGKPRVRLLWFWAICLTGIPVLILVIDLIGRLIY